MNDFVLTRDVSKDEITSEKTLIKFVSIPSTEVYEVISSSDAGEATQTQNLDNFILHLKMKCMRSQIQNPSKFDVFVMLAEENEKFTFQEVIDSSNRRDAMQKGLNSLNENYKDVSKSTTRKKNN